MAVWFLTLMALLSGRVYIDYVDIVELNHVICPTNGNEQGVYWVWWRWQTVDGVSDYYVADWRRQADVPRPTTGTNCVQEFWDNKARVSRRIESCLFAESWTFYDRESEDRKRLPESRRRKLRAR